MKEQTAFEIWQDVITQKRKKFPNGFFLGQSGRENLKYILQKIFISKGWTKGDCLELFNTQFLKDNKLMGVATVQYDASAYKVLCVVYPEIKFWEMKHAPNSSWTDEATVEATKWLIEEKLKWSKDDIKKNLTKDVFIENGLSGAIYSHKRNGSVYRAIELTYGPDYIKPWQMRCAPMSYWSAETCKLPLFDLVDRGYSKVDLMYLTEEKMIEEGFYTAYTLFNDSLVELLNNAFPDEYKKVLNEIYHVPSQIKKEAWYKSSKTNENGVYYNQKTEKWIAQYTDSTAGAKRIGTYKTKSEAIAARRKKEIELLNK